MSNKCKEIRILTDILKVKNLTITEKILLSQIEALDKEEGCFATNSYFAELFSLSKTQVSNIISDLKKKGWITVVRNYENRTQGYVRNKTNYQIAHLLELGHKARNGRPVAAIEHIRKGQDDARAELDKRIKEILEKE